MTKAVAAASIDVTANITKLQKQLDRAESRLKRMEGKTRSTSKSMRTSFNGVATSIKAMTVAAAGFASAFVVKDVVNAGIAMQGLDRAFKAAAGSATAGAREMAFVRSEADRLGLDLETSAKAYAKLTAAAQGTSLAGQDARDIFAAVSEASRVMSLSTEQTAGALTAIEQIISKGKVSAEELRGQLGERLPGAFQIAARSIGVTTAELDDMLKAGKLTAEDLLPAMAKELRKTFGPGVEDAANDAQAAFNRFNTAVFDLKVTIAESGVLDAITILARHASDAARDVGTFLVRIGLIKNADGIKQVSAGIAQANIELKEAKEYLGFLSGLDARSGSSKVVDPADLAAANNAVILLENRLVSLIQKRNDLQSSTITTPIVPDRGTSTGSPPIEQIRADAEAAAEIRLQALRAEKAGELLIEQEFQRAQLEGRAVTNEQLLAMAANFAAAKVNAEVAAEQAAKGELGKALTAEEEIERITAINNEKLAAYERFATEKQRIEAAAAKEAIKTAKQEADSKLAFQQTMLGGARQFFAKNKTISAAIQAFEQKKQIVNAWNSTKTGMAKALEWGWPMGPVFAAAIGAMGAANIASMIGVGGGGGGGVASAPGGTPTVSNVPSVDTQDTEAEQAPAGVQIVIQGDLVGDEQHILKVAEAIREAVRDKDYILIDSDSRNGQEIAEALT